MKFPVFISFFGCFAIELGVRAFGKSKTQANLTSCLCFQVCFILNSLYLTMLSCCKPNTNLIKSTKNNLDLLAGYFVYDIFAIFSLWSGLFSLGYLIHHILGIVMILSLKNMEMLVDNIFYYNLYCFVAEFQNPMTIILALKNKESDIYYFGIYTVFRIFLFPLLSYKTYLINKKINHKMAGYIYFSSKVIYAISVIYYLYILIS